MELLKKYFPLSFYGKDLASMIVAIIVYVVVDIVCGGVGALLGGIPVLGVIVGVVCTIVGVYALAGIVIAVLNYLNVLKD